MELKTEVIRRELRFHSLFLYDILLLHVQLLMLNPWFCHLIAVLRIKVLQQYTPRQPHQDLNLSGPISSEEK